VWLSAVRSTLATKSNYFNAPRWRGLLARDTLVADPQFSKYKFRAGWQPTIHFSMATFDELSLTVRLFLKGYPFSRYAIEPTPVAFLRKPLSASRVALVTTAGLHTPAQEGFDFSNKMGDASFREISNDVETQSLIESHRSNSFDHSGVEADRNLVFPLDRMRELLAQNVLGELNHRHFSFMGSVVGPRKLIAETAPQVAALLKADAVDAVLLTPV
jgi:D-proline reductase (dithiol) PrdB